MAVGLQRCREAAASLSSRSSPIIVCAVLFLITVVSACGVRAGSQSGRRMGMRHATFPLERAGLLSDKKGRGCLVSTVAETSHHAGQLQPGNGSAL